MGYKPAEAITRIDGDGVWKEGEDAQEIERQKIEEVM
jgi:hypothetical protein